MFAAPNIPATRLTTETWWTRMGLGVHRNIGNHLGRHVCTALRGLTLIISHLKSMKKCFWVTRTETLLCTHIYVYEYTESEDTTRHITFIQSETPVSV
ncbi:hypothetical protein CEXT_614321 [Caerostris extrusa]|uniref:Uncharacterized protein n=1 Tax=Caerostris extrusa TaxID=172846 RepID=A0AAV4MEP7_CAEEX|nr:hypothetical protein CEXT_614321 [Caerostris extrusa]